MNGKKFPPTLSKDPGATLSGLIADAYKSLEEIQGTHPHAAALIKTTLEQIKLAASQAPKRSKNMKAILKKWQELPRTGDSPPLRLLVTTEIEGRGGLKVSWTPSLSSYDHKQTFHALLMTEFGPAENVMIIPRFRELAILMNRAANSTPDHLVLALRYTLWAGTILGRLIADRLGSVVPTAQIKDIDITLSGDIRDKNLEREHYAKLTGWLRNYDHEVPLELLHHGYLAGMTAVSLRDMCWRSGLKSITLIDTIRDLKAIGEAVDYNKAWWRTGSTIPLPEPKGFARPHN